MVRQLGFATIGAFTQVGSGQRIVGATHVSLGARNFTLGNGHRSFFHSRLTPTGPAISV